MTLTNSQIFHSSNDMTLHYTHAVGMIMLLKQSYTGNTGEEERPFDIESMESRKIIEM